MSDLEDREMDIVAGPGSAAAAARRGSRRKLALLGVLAGLVLIAVSMDVYYLVARKPLAQMVPAAIAVAKAVPPSYVTSFYGMNQPQGVAVSPDAQRVYVSEGAQDRLIRAYDSTGRELFNITPPDSDASSRAPFYMAVDGKGQLYVADPTRGRVSIFSPDGRFVSDVTPPQDAPFSGPMGVSFDRSGNLLVADATKNNHSVLVLDPQGKLVRRLGGSTGDINLNFPQQAATDSRGRVYVSDGNNGRVDLFGPDGKYLGPLAGGNDKGAVALPRGIAVDSLDRLYIVDTVGCEVEVFDVSGDKPTFLYNFGANGDGDGQMRFPVGIAVDATGRIYVADRVNSRVQLWSY